MIASFADRGTEDLFYARDTREARKTLARVLWAGARRKLDALYAAHSLPDLRSPPGNHLEALRGNRKGQHSLRVNDQYRIVFRWEGDQAHDVQIVDYH